MAVPDQEGPRVFVFEQGDGCRTKVRVGWQSVWMAELWDLESQGFGQLV